jgi:hypothetical protein
VKDLNDAAGPRPVVYAKAEDLAQVKGCNGVGVWCENPAIYNADCRPPLSLVPLFDIDELWRVAARAAEIESGKTKAAQAERDRLRDALIACRESVWRSLDRFRMMSPTDESRQLSALLDTIDAAAKGQG